MESTEAILMALLGLLIGWLIWLIPGLLIGSLLIPALILLLGDSLPAKKTFGDINVVLGQIAYNGSALIYDRGRAVLAPYDADTHRLRIDGEWRDAGRVDHEYRLGLRPFAVTYNPALLDEYTPPDTVEPGSVLDETRGGYQAYLPDTDIQGRLVHAARYLKEIGRGGTRLYNRAEEEALKEYGGDDQLGQLWLLASVVVTMLVMFVVTWVFLGM